MDRARVPMTMNSTIGTMTSRMDLGQILLRNFSTGACTSRTSTMGMTELVYRTR